MMENRIHSVPPADSGPGTVKRWQLAGYASGNFGKNLLWSTAELTLLFLFTDVMGVAPGLAGAIIFASLCINAIMDPLMGGLADRVRSPMGGSAPMILLGAPVSGFAFALLYALPAAGAVSLVTAVALLFMFRVGFAIMDSPHNAALVTLVRDPARRGALSSLRFVFSSLATLAVVAVIPALLAARNAGGATQLAVTATIAGTLSAIVMTVAALAVCRLDRPEQVWAIERPERNLHPAMLRSGPVIMVLALAFTLSTGVPLYGKMIIYHASYVVVDPPRANAMFLAMIVGQIAGMPVWIYALRRSLTPDALGIAIIVLIAVAALMAICGGQSAVGDVTLALCFGLGAGGIYSIIWVVAAECADRVACTNDVTPTGVLFGFVIVSMKLGQGAGAFASGQLLAYAGYVPKAIQNDYVVSAITAISIGGPIIAGVTAMVFLSRYRIYLRGASNLSR
jgi:glycoside/pentoside/hexuronide:cation symporter, GPH family